MSEAEKRVMKEMMAGRKKKSPSRESEKESDEEQEKPPTKTRKTSKDLMAKE